LKVVEEVLASDEEIVTEEKGEGSGAGRPSHNPEYKVKKRNPKRPSQKPKRRKKVDRIKPQESREVERDVGKEGDPDLDRHKAALEVIETAMRIQE